MGGAQSLCCQSNASSCDCNSDSFIFRRCQWNYEVPKKKTIYLVGTANNQITGAKLPSNRQIPAVLFFNIWEVKLTVSESGNLVIHECIIFWEKVRIPTKSSPNCKETCGSSSCLVGASQK